MNRATSLRRAGWLLALPAAACLVQDGTGPALGDHGSGPQAGAPAEVARGPSAGATAGREVRAVPRVEGSRVPGGRTRLVGDDSTGSDLRFRWVQVRGPAVTLDRPGGPEASFVAPEAGTLGFLLVVAGREGGDSAELTVRVEEPPAGPARTTPTADAGDDQIGVVGSQVTLNGARSGPRGQVGFRWVQTGGPTVRFKIEDGPIHSFVPTVPGVYRFALVVASGSTISAADEVVVRVGSGPAGGEGRGDLAEAGASPARRPAATPTQEVARAGLVAVRGAESAEDLARVFDDTADRMGLYRTYGEAFSEMSRRLEGCLPAEPGRRQAWVERLFQPLSARALDVLRAEGLELLQPGASDADLDEPQKAALAEQFRLIAEGFRTVAGPVPR